MHRIGQALLLWAVVGGPILLWWPPALRFPALWAVVALSVSANALQPSYRLRDAARPPADRGTFHQIMLTAYGFQAAALVELVLRRPPALPLDALGGAALLVMGAGLGLRTWAVATLGGWFTLEVGVKPAQRLVRAGPYRLIRHPSYTGALVALIASAVLLRAWVTAVVGAIALYVAFRRRIRHEERLLVAALAGYRRYMARTGALLPRWGLRPAGRRRLRRDGGEASPGSGRRPGGRRLPA
jgi:protein-S-isoprenylcysteine O-methyltransferase